MTKPASPPIAPPNDMVAESSVLSALLIVSNHALVETVHGICAPQDFYSEAHRRIFEAIVDLVAVGEPVDTTTVANKLKSRKRLEQVGGFGYLTEIINAAPHVTEEHVLRYAEIVREKAQLRALIQRMHRGIAEAMLDPDEPQKWAEALESDISRLAARRAVSTFRHVREILDDSWQAMTAASKGKRGWDTGLRELNRILGGLHPGDLTIVAARPAMGKTAFVMGMVKAITADPNAAACVFELEMPDVQLGIRMLSSDAGVNVGRARDGKYASDDWTKLATASERLNRSHIYVDDSCDLDFHEIKVRLKRQIRELERQGITVRLVVLDYIGLVDVGDGNRSEAIGKLSGGLKKLAKEFNLAVVALSQLSRKCEERTDKRPIMSDLRDSGNIEQDADNIIFIYRDEVYNKNTAAKGVAELNVAKQRNGDTGTVCVEFRKWTTSFLDLPDMEEDQEPRGIDGRY